MSLHPEHRVMVAEGSVTIWLNRLSEGDTQAAQILWDRFFERMVRVARSRLAQNGNQKGEEEDVALSAFHEFFRAVADDRFAQLANRNDLWQVLYLLISRKAVDHYRHAKRQKRDELRTVALDHDVAVSDTDPALTAGIADDLRALFDRLPSSTLRQVAVLKLDGYTNEEIAEQLHCTVRTVRRRVGLIRSLWTPAET
jgi:RNA polymerase sigma factor (sigma-70 family)